MYVRPAARPQLPSQPSAVERPLLGHLIGTRPSDISAVSDRSGAINVPVGDADYFILK